MKIMLKNPTQPNPTQPNPPLIYLIIFVSLISLFSLSCSFKKIHGLEKYNGNVYVSVTPEITGGEGEFTYYYYRWIYIENGLVHSIQSEGNTKKPYFETWVDDGISKYPTGIYFKGSGNSYSYEDKSYNYNPDNDENIPEYYTYKVTLEFSEDGKSIAYNSIESGDYWNDYGTRTLNLTLTLFKETGTTEEPEPPEVIPPEIIEP